MAGAGLSGRRGGMARATCGQSEFTCRVRKSSGRSVVLRQSPLDSRLLYSQLSPSSTYHAWLRRSRKTVQSVLTTKERLVAGISTNAGGPSISIKRDGLVATTIRGGSGFRFSTVWGRSAIATEANTSRLNKANR